MTRPIFKDNVVIITGASRGIGAQSAFQLADQGAWLSLAARDAARLENVASECRKRDSRACTVPTDVSIQEQCRALIERTVREYGRIDTLINNAGIGMWALFEEVKDPAFYERIMQVNYLGSVFCTFYALPYLKQSRGRIVAVSSLTGKTGVPTRSGYAASKHAMVGFFDSLRIELLKTGVSVTIAFPDFVATDIRASNFGPDGKPLGTSPAREDMMMSVETCARYLIRGAARRDREILMTPRGKLGPWMKLIAPGLVDRFTLNAIKAIRSG